MRTEGHDFLVGSAVGSIFEFPHQSCAIPFYALRHIWVWTFAAPRFPALTVTVAGAMPGVGPDVLKGEDARLASGQGWQGQVVITTAESLDVQYVRLLIAVHLSDVKGVDVVNVV
ncbi:hypothetical protein ACFLT5_00095 [Chloroflexota bacterium]